MSTSQVFRNRFKALGTGCEIVLDGCDKKAAQEISSNVIAEVARFEAKYSRFRPDSVVGHINASSGSGKTIPIDEETLKLLNYANQLYQYSDGLFDITAGALSKIWDFRNAIVPSADLLKETLSVVGWENIELTTSGLKILKPGVQLDFGGFGKEYAVDVAANMIKSFGIENGFINFGGDVVVLGPQRDGAPWKLAMDNPRTDGKTLGVLPVSKGAVATSGDSERFFEIEGKRYSHIINPKTGMPASYLASATVVADSCLIAGANSTLAVLLEDKAESFLEKTSHQFMLVNFDGKIINFK